MEANKPKFIAVDSAILGEWSKDFYSSSLNLREISGKILSQMILANWIFVLTLHHFEELISYCGEAIVERRIQFLLNLPKIAWIWRADGLNNIGSVVDVQAAEIKAHLSAGNENNIEKLISATRECFLRLGKPSDIPALNDWRGLRPYLMAMSKMRQEIASIMHTSSNVNDNVLLSDLNSKTRMTAEEAKQAYGEEILAVKNEIIKDGDKRLSNPEAVAKRFCNEIFSNIATISMNNRNNAEAFIEQFGLKPKDFSQNVTLGEFREVATRRKKLTNVAKQLGLEIESIWHKFKDNRLPSEEIEDEIRKYRKNARRASGSDLNDDYLASLIPYLDAVIVDKRTYEYLQQAKRRRPELASLIVSAIKISSYRELPERLKQSKH